MKKSSTVILIIVLTIIGFLICTCCICFGLPIVMSVFVTPSASDVVISPQIDITPTEEIEITVRETILPTKEVKVTPTKRLTNTPVPLPSSTSTPKPTNQEPTLTATPTIEPLVNICDILGKSAGEVEQIIGASILVTPNDDYDDKLAGGEYRDYNLGEYTVFIAYDKNGIARVFQVLGGLSNENYSLTQWDLILPKFGLNLDINPSSEAPAALYWDNYHDYFIAVIASNTKGQPVWSIQIAQVGYEP